MLGARLEFWRGSAVPSIEAMKLCRAVLDVMRGATGAAMVMSVGCSSLGQAAPPPPPPASAVAQSPVRRAPVVLQPLPPLPHGADVPSDLVPLPAEEPAAHPPQHPTHVSSHTPRPNQVVSQPIWTPGPGLDPNNGDIGEIGPVGMPDNIAAACGRG